LCITGLEIIQSKIYGIELPDEFRETEVVALDTEIDELAKKIQKCLSLSKSFETSRRGLIGVYDVGYQFHEQRLLSGTILSMMC
jgi:hypothetical protein